MSFVIVFNRFFELIFFKFSTAFVVHLFLPFVMLNSCIDYGHNMLRQCRKKCFLKYINRK
jgi:hypothetical protein